MDIKRLIYGQAIKNTFRQETFRRDSMTSTVKGDISTRKIAFLVADGVDRKAVESVQKALLSKGAMVGLIAPRLGSVTTRLIVLSDPGSLARLFTLAIGQHRFWKREKGRKVPA